MNSGEYDKFDRGMVFDAYQLWRIYFASILQIRNPVKIDFFGRVIMGIRLKSYKLVNKITGIHVL